MPPPLFDVEELARFLSRSLASEDQAYVLEETARLVSDLVRGYCRSTITAATSTVALAGGPARRLTLPETPVMGVSAIAVDGAPLGPTDYSWRRSGTLWRASGGWGSTESEVVVTYSHGWAEVPGDLRAVALAAAARLAPNLSQLTYESDGTYSARGSFAGFTLTERITLDRYRRRTAAL